MVIDMILLWSILFASVGVAVGGVTPTFIKQTRPFHARLLSICSVPAVGLLTFSTLAVVAAEISAISTAAHLPLGAWATAGLLATAMMAVCLRLWILDGRRV